MPVVSHHGPSLSDLARTFKFLQHEDTAYGMLAICQ